jgi:hypothetical protein
MCGLNGHIMTNCLKFIDVVDVNVATKSKATKKQVFKDRKQRKVKSFVDWEKEKRLKKSMVGIIQ